MSAVKSKEQRAADILLVEDNDDDVVITRRGLQASKFKINLHHVEDGERCMAFLRKQGEYNNVPTPDLILLDLNLPLKNGREVLKEIVQDVSLRSLPVVILTTSTDERDISEMYALRCSSYISKPIDFDKFKTVIKDLTDYWFATVLLPSEQT